MKLVELYPNSISIRLTEKQYKRLERICNKYQKKELAMRNIIVELINRRYKYINGSYRI